MLLGLVATSTFADVAGTLGNYISQAPMSITGNLEFDANARLGGSGPFSVHLNGSRGNNSRGMSFSLTEDGLSLDTRSDLSVRIIGIPIPIDIRSISYRHPGSFSVDTNWPGGLGEKELEDYLNNAYGARMETAFRRLRSLRRQNNLNDVGRVITEIRDIIAPANPGAPSVIPRTRGQVTLTMTEPRGTSLELDQFVVHIAPGTQVDTRLGFMFENGRATIESAQVTTHQGIRVARRGVDDPLQQLVFHSFALDGDRFDMNYNFSAQQILVLLETIVRPTAECVSCAVETTALRNQIDPVLGREISTLARRHQDQLRAMGVEPSLLRTLYSAFPPSGE
jgi:hypothetical protein